MRRLLDKDARAGSLFGAHRGSVRVREGVDLVAPALDVEPEAGSGRVSFIISNIAIRPIDS